jgi:hypothetical protein
MIYGSKIPAYQAYPPGLIAEPELSPSGNVVLRVGRPIEPDGWQQTEHVVLTRGEALDLCDAIMTSIDLPPGSAAR